MTSDEIAMQVYATLCDHFETDDSGFEAEAARWRQIIERCGLTMSRAQGVVSEVCGQNETLTPGEFLRAFEDAAFVSAKVTKQREKTHPTRCGYCRDSGFATIYHHRDPSVTEAVGCRCPRGQAVLKAELEAVMKEDPKNMHPKPRFATAIDEPSLFDAIRLYHRHQNENAQEWAKRNGLAGKDESEFYDRCREVLEVVRKGMFQRPGQPARKKPPGDFARANAALAEVRKPAKPTPPPQLNPEALALAAFSNGDERNDWE